MGKQYKGKTCVYCSCPGISEDGDHILSKQFVLLGKRTGLPKVPACKACNNAKSVLEHYLTAVMPFGGQQTGASENLSAMVPPRLEKNRRLRDSLTLLRSAVYTSHNGGPWIRRTSLPFDGEKLLELTEMMARGLAFHHWGTVFARDDIVRATLLTRYGRRLVDPLFLKNPKRRVHGNIGDAALIYEAVETVDVPRVTLWKMSLYRAEMQGSARNAELASTIYVFTAPVNATAAIKFIDAVTG